MEVIAEGDDAGGDAFEHCGQILIRLRQRLALLIELQRHLIERLDQSPHFVGSLHVHPRSISPLREFARRLGECLDGNGDAARRVNRKP